MANVTLKYQEGHDDPSLQWKWPLLLLVCCGIASLAPFFRTKVRNLKGLPLPPGPRGIPIFGNVFELAKGAKTGSWRMYADWAKEYASDLVYVEAMGQSILVLNSYKAVHDLLERRAPNYSDRVVPPALGMLRSDWAITIMNYGPWWRSHRRAFHQHYNINAVHMYGGIIEHQTFEFLKRLSVAPKSFMEETRYLFGSIIIRVSYGLTDPVASQELTDTAETMANGFSEAAEPGRFLVDTFPALRYVPTWVPGTSWKQRLEHVAELQQHALRKHFDDAMQRHESGVESEYPDVASRLIGKLPSKDEPSYEHEQEIARNITLIAYVAGSDTTVSSGQALYIALANNPEVQRCAQRELDTVVGPCRLPKYSDMPQLNYIQAIVKEVNRWHNPLPMAFPHVCKEDDEYNGYFIPKGTVVLGNAWAIMHSEAHFTDPMEFRPERYMKDGRLNSETLDPDVAAFGFGRRICPGRHLSTASLTFMAASLLSVFNVERKKDPDGNPMPLKLENTKGIINKPVPFKVDLHLRSKDHGSLLVGSGE